MNNVRKNISDCLSNIIMEGDSMQKILLICLIFISVVLTTSTIHAQEAKGPRIIHEEEVITVFEDGKEIEKHYVGKQSLQERAILKDAHDKKRSIKKTDVQHPKLIFYDENGKQVKEMDLSSEKRQGKIKETRPGWKKGEFDVDIEIVKRPLLSKQVNFAIMNNTTYASRASRGEGVIETGKIILYDAKGNALFEKQYPHGRSIASGMVVADSGTVALATSEGDEGPQDQVLYVYDKTGKELLVYPAKDEEKVSAHTMGGGKKPKKVKNSAEVEKPDMIEVLKISASGRYLAIRAGFEYKYTRTVFFDLEKNTFWKADRSYVVYEISDNGDVTADYYDETTRKPSKTVYINLTEKR